MTIFLLTATTTLVQAEGRCGDNWSLEAIIELAHKNGAKIYGLSEEGYKLYDEWVSNHNSELKFKDANAYFFIVANDLIYVQPLDEHLCNSTIGIRYHITYWQKFLQTLKSKNLNWNDYLTEFKAPNGTPS